MAGNIAPKVVLDGLILYLDAANTKSYTIGDTTWNDISRSGNNGTLVNGPTFSSNNGGSMVFDGVDDYIINTLPLLSIFSFSIFVNRYTTPLVNESFMTTTGNLNRFIYSAGLGFYWRIRLLDGTYTNLSTGSNYVKLNTWYNISVTYDGDVVNFYKNGQLTHTFSGISVYEEFGNTLYIGANLTNSAYFNGAVVTTQIYNKALSAQEVLQNYNATKTRFI
jgi:hypothetical protein